MRTYFKCLIAFSMFMFAGQPLSAQLVIQPSVPHVGALMFRQLWNGVIINASGETWTGKISLIITGRDNGSNVYEVETINEVAFNNGSTLYNYQSINGLLIKNDRLGVGLDPGKMLPVGRYTICFRLEGVAGKKGQQLAQQCLNVDVEALMPPELVFPNNLSKLNTPSVVLSWIPPSPHTMFTDLNYEVRLVEKSATQQNIDAIERNTPLFFVERQYPNFLQVPTSVFEKIDTSKHYAWQVIARNGEVYAGKTSVWSFQFSQNPSVEEKPVLHLSDDIGQLSKSISSAERLLLHFDYRGNGGSAILVIKEYESTGKELLRNTVPLVLGDNYCAIHVPKGVKKGKVYKVVLYENGVEIRGAIIGFNDK